MNYLIYGAVLLLAVLHHDFWWWDDKTLVFGFMPIGLAYHALFTILAAGVWALACRYAWPRHVEELAESGDKPAGDS